MEERRQHVRVTGPFEGHWHGGSGATEVRISDISLGGCFVETLVQPVPGEDTEVTVCFTPADSVTIAGHVVYSEPGLGFAVKFRELTAEEASALKKFLHQE